MAQRKSPPPGKPTSKKSTSRPAGKPAGATSSATKPGATKTAGDRKPAVGGRPSGKPPARKGKSIVNQKQTPWGLIASAAAVVLFAAAVIIVVIATSKSDSGGSTHATKGGQTVDKSDPYRQPALAKAMAITGVTYRVEAQHNHVEGHITYDATPPVGGNHSQYWADCTGTVYDKAIANENAVHMLEHGAIWITYNPATLPAAQLTELKGYVSGVDRLALSPYPNLKSPISLQSWGYQLFVDKASDPRIAQFISTLKFNPKTTPESGATCQQATFKQHPSTFGNPLWTSATG